MKLIVDSGATKAAWVLSDNGKQVEKWTTEGINPYFTPPELIQKTIHNGIGPHQEKVKEIYYYGTGCTEERNKRIIAAAFEKALLAKNRFIEVHTDILAAARALCQRKKGIACILGTGSNACRYDGEKIIQNINGYGYILGDFGSGAALGKKLISDWLFKQMPDHLGKMFQSDYDLEVAGILDKVYRGSSPSRYLASFAPFVHSHISEKYIRDLLEDHFSRFLDTLIQPLLVDGKDLSVNFIGSVAFFFQDTIKSLALQKEISIGRFLRDPMEGLIKYHT